jgi:hypothetical protein
MQRAGDVWTVRGPFGSVEVELDPAASLDAASGEASLRELRRLVYDFKYRDPEARRVVFAVHARLQGLGSTAAGRGDDLDTGSPRAAPPPSGRSCSMRPAVTLIATTVSSRFVRVTVPEAEGPTARHIYIRAVIQCAQEQTVHNNPKAPGCPPKFFGK